MTAKGITEVYLNVPCNILVADLTNITVRVPNYMALCSSSDSMANRIDAEQVDKERRHMVTTVETASKPFVQENERSNTQNTSEDRRGTITTPSKDATYRTRFFNKLEKSQ